VVFTSGPLGRTLGEQEEETLGEWSGDEKEL